MTWEIAYVLALAIGIFVLLLTERLSPDLVALMAMGALLVSGVLDPAQAFSVFAQEAPIAIACMFIISAALEETGTIRSWVRKLDRFGANTELRLLILILPLVAVTSAFVNNTPVVVVFMPILVSMAARKGIKPSKLLMPLSFAAILGGNCTLIGTSTNLLVSGSAQAHGLQPLGMFELAGIGLILAVVGILYMLTLGSRLLPARDSLASILESTESKQYLTEAVILEGSPLVGKCLTDTPLLPLPGSRILDVTRSGEVLDQPLNTIVLRQGDRLRLTTVLSGMMEMKKLKGIGIFSEPNLGLEPVGLQKAMLVESVIGPSSELIGKSIEQINFRQRYGILILAIHRKGRNLRRDFARVRLQMGDTILLEGAESSIRRLRSDPDFLLLSDVLQHPSRQNKQWIPIVTVGLVVTLAGLNLAPISVLALLGALTVILTRCLDSTQVYSAIPWSILFLIFGMLSIGVAMDETGAAQWLADNLVAVLGNWGPTVVLSAFFLLASALTAFISNNAVAVVFTPVAIAIAHDLGVEPRAFLVATALAASASFTTPIGYQTNTLVYGAGGYRFTDFIRVGLPLTLICWILATLLIPLFWPFTSTPAPISDF